MRIQIHKKYQADGERYYWILVDDGSAIAQSYGTLKSPSAAEKDARNSIAQIRRGAASEDVPVTHAFSHGAVGRPPAPSSPTVRTATDKFIERWLWIIVATVVFTWLTR